MRQINGMDVIQHLAIPLELQKGIPSKQQWHDILTTMKGLKTVTFMVGSKEKSWRGTQRSIELRDMDQWFVDGRSREVLRGDGGTIDIKDMESYLKDPAAFTSFAGSPARRRLGRPASRVINVRVVAWKRGGRS